MNERAVHVSITGLVQGVGYRAWVEREALSRGVAGWVRNRRDGSVEAVFAGESGTVDAILVACRHGPGMAQVHEVITSEVTDPAGYGFRVLPTT
jgi:acylphosphatase